MKLLGRYILAAWYFLAMLFVILIYSRALSFFFFQDDFFELNISQADNLLSYFKLFVFRGDIIAYRPISLQNYFYFSNYFFNLNPAGFRFITISILLLNSFLITKVIASITKSSKAGVITAVFWLTSSIHFMAITWIAAAYNIIGTFFFLLTTWLFLKHIDSKSSKYYIFSLIAFLLTIGSFEFSVTWPPIFFLYSIFNRLSSANAFKKMAPFFIISIIYLAARFLFIKIPNVTEYQLALNVDSLKAFIWYVLWSFNIPEEFKKQISHNLFIFNQTFLWQFWQLISRSVILLFWILTLTVAVPIYLGLKKNKSLNIKLIVFFFSWFILGILPVLFLPNHTFTMYLTLSSIGIYALLAYFLVFAKSRGLIIASFLIWVLSSLSTLNFYYLNFWMIEAQKTSLNVTSGLKLKFPALPKNSAVFYFQPYTWQVQALSNMESIKAIYNDPSLQIFYNKESLLKDYKAGKIPGYVFIY